MQIVLRDYQEATISGLRAGIKDGHRAQMVMAGTGAGKSVIAASLMKAAKDKGSRCAFVVDRVSLVNQTSDLLDRYGIEHGVIQAGHWRNRGYEYIQVCSAQTLEKRGFFPDLKLLIVDEAHAMRKATSALIKNKADLMVVGLSATPFSKGLAELYTNVINVATTNQLIREGWLAPLKIYAAKQINMDGAKVVAGEWAEKEIEERGLKIVGDIVSEWTAKTNEHFGGPVKTIVFSATVDHGTELCRQFNAAGHEFQQISYKDSPEEAAAKIEDFRRPDTRITGLISCEVLSRGFDVPDVLCGVSARPYRKSLSSHIQQLGRVMRSSPGKEFGLWLCVARGSRVLTDRGLVPIEKVSLSDKIWDGTNFVTHGGAVCNGKQGTIRYQGLEATPGHLVHTQAGWRTFGECASKQIAITQTGLGGTPIREGEGHFAGRAVAGLEAQTVHSRRLRVRDVWLSGRHFAGEFGRWANGWVQALRTACTGIPAMALCASAGDAREMQEPEGCPVPSVRGPWNPVSVLWREGRDVVDHEKHRLPGARPLPATGSDRPGRTLRAGEPALASGGAQPAKQGRESGGCEAPQVQAGAPGDSLCGSDVDSVFLVRDERGGNHREVQQAVGETEREVWDILDCGPRNRFTCEGLLVHNCHSGNAIRFSDDVDRVWSQGVDSLTGDSLDSKVRNDPSPEELCQIKCRSCGFVLPPKLTTCPACGHEKPERVNGIESVPGRMFLINGMEIAENGPKSFLLDKNAVWRQLSQMALGRKKNDQKAAQSFAQAQYKSIYGEFRKGRVEDAEPMAPCDELSRMVRAHLIRRSYATRKQRAA